jgi:ABC-type sugar transport system permease subunit
VTFSATVVVDVVGEVVDEIGGEEEGEVVEVVELVVGGAVVVVVVVVVVGVPVAMFDAAESPIALTALMVTEYVVPFVSPEMVNGLEIDAGFNAKYVTPSVEYL